MGNSKQGQASVKQISLDDFLRANLKKYIKGLNGLENGGGLHPMVICTVEKHLLEMVMDESGGNQSQAAHILGLNRNTLRRKLTDYNIKVKKQN